MNRKHKLILGVLAIFIALEASVLTVAAAGGEVAGYDINHIFAAAAITGIVLVVPFAYKWQPGLLISGMMILGSLGGYLAVNWEETPDELGITPDNVWAVSANSTSGCGNATVISPLNIRILCAINTTGHLLYNEHATYGGASAKLLANPVAYFAMRPTPSAPNTLVDETIGVSNIADIVGTIGTVTGTTESYDIITHTGSGAAKVQHVNWTWEDSMEHDDISFTVTQGTVGVLRLEIDPNPLAITQLSAHDSVSFQVSVAGTVFSIEILVVTEFI